MEGRNGMRRREFLKMLGGTGCAMAMAGSLKTTCGLAAEPYPAGKITWIVGQPPGGSVDLTARGVAPFLQRYLKKLSSNPGKVGVIIKNITGGAEVRALNTLYHAKPDGYTIGLATDKLHTGSLLSQLEFNLFELTFLARLGSGIKILVTNNQSNLRTWDDAVKASKKSPLRIAVGGFGTSNHTAAILLIDTTRLAAKTIQFDGTAGTNAALIRGDVHFLINSEDSLNTMIGTKQFRPVLTFSEKTSYPDVSNVKDIGFPELLEPIKSQRYAIAPPGLPADIKKMLEDSMKKTMVDKEFIAWREKVGLSFDPVIGPELDKMVKDIHGFYKSKEKVLRSYLVE